MPFPPKKFTFIALPMISLLSLPPIKFRVRSLGGGGGSEQLIKELSEMRMALEEKNQELEVIKD